MRFRRCSSVFIEPRETVGFDLTRVMAGHSGVTSTIQWLALAPHLDEALAVNAAQRALLGQVSAQHWCQKDDFDQAAWPDIEALLQKGLLIGEDDALAPLRARDESLRNAHWWPLAALAHRFGRWQGVDSVSAMEENGMATAVDLRDKLGAPPPAAPSRRDAGTPVALVRLADDAYASMLAKRTTCRNFDPVRGLSLQQLTRVLQRVLMAQAQEVVQDDAVFLKKNVPSGGSMHPTDAYLLVHRVEGLRPGLYHYQALDHVLEPLPTPSQPLRALASTMLAGQHWFVDAPVHLILAPRFPRCNWKYRSHPKAYRAVMLDVGHISQAIYMCATDMGLAAFVTAAINEVDVEQAFGLDPMLEGPLAICGIGWRGEQMRNSEFDPDGHVWQPGTA